MGSRIANRRQRVPSMSRYITKGVCRQQVYTARAIKSKVQKTELQNYKNWECTESVGTHVSNTTNWQQNTHRLKFTSKRRLTRQTNQGGADNQNNKGKKCEAEHDTEGKDYKIKQETAVEPQTITQEIRLTKLTSHRPSYTRRRTKVHFNWWWSL